MKESKRNNGKKEINRKNKIKSTRGVKNKKKEGTLKINNKTKGKRENTQRNVSLNPL